MMKNTNETAIRELVENWALAVRTNNIAGILAHHDAHIVMYDVPYPFQSVGINAYRETWDTFFNGTKPGTFDFQELSIMAGDDVAFCYGTMKCMNGSGKGNFEPLDFRVTIGLKKIKDQWTVIHEHHSIPSH